MTPCAPPSSVCGQPTRASGSSTTRKGRATVKSIAMACFVRRTGGSFATRPTTICGCRDIWKTWKPRWRTRISSAPHVNVEREDRVRGYFFDIERPEFKDLWVAWQAHPYGPWASNGFGLAFAGRRLEAYLRLPEGWTTTPTGLPTDQFMWMKFARQPWCRIRSLQWPVSLHFPAPDRRNWTEQQRVDELARWTDIIARPGGREHVCRAMLRTFGDLMLEHGLMVTQQQAAAAAAPAAALEREQALRAKAEGERDAEQTLRTKAEAERAAEQTLRAKAEADRDAEQGVHTYAQAERDAEQMLRAQVEAERDAMRESTFWRLTGPLRAMINLFKGL
jgi:hypothetical protein